MSSAPARIPPKLGRAIRGIAWTALLAVLAAGAAGLIAQASHVPGGPARAELTAEGDAALNARLDEAAARLERISADVDALADDAKTALEELASADTTKLNDSLRRGGDMAERIDAEADALQATLTGLPGSEPDAPLHYANDTLVRRAAVLTAVEAAASLNGHWLQVTAKAVEVSGLTTLIAQHDQTVLDAAAKGRTSEFADAAKRLDDAILVLVDVKAQRDRLIADTGPTVLDEWIDRSRDYDLALQGLYVALAESGGKVTVKVQLARAAEQKALGRLPPDRRTIIVIVAEVARGGLTQAVLAIEDARGRIDDALAEAGAEPAPSGAPVESAPPGSPAPAQSAGAGESEVPLP